MTDPFWNSRCWHQRFTEDPCMKLATYKGPNVETDFCRNWRACDEHHLDSDIPLEDANETE